MQKKLIFALLATALVAAALIGVTLAQFVGAQTQNNTVPQQLVQLPNGQYVYGIPSGVNGTVIIPCYPYGVQQGAPAGSQQGNIPSYQYSGRGMCGRFW